MEKLITYIAFIIFLSACSSEKYDEGKEAWLNDAFSTIMSDNDIKAVSYWNENWEDKKYVDMVINSTPEALLVYQQNIANDYFVDSANVSNLKVLAPINGAYHCAYPGFSENGGTEEVVTTNKIDNFVNTANKNIVWCYFSNSWHNGIVFPQNEIDIINQSGQIPFVRMMAWSEIAPHLAQSDPVYTMQKFIDGDFDTDLRIWAQSLIAFGQPVIIEFGTEVDGNWMPWNGEWNGAGEMSYGDANIPDGPERFRDAYRHIIDLFEAEGVQNATWVFHVNYSPTPDDEWNNMKYYYPGDEYIDWLGVSIYGPMYKKQKWSYSFTDLWNYVKPNLKSLSIVKPIAILEYGVGEH